MNRSSYIAKPTSSGWVDGYEASGAGEREAGSKKIVEVSEGEGREGKRTGDDNMAGRGWYC
jgi:hypothetical protein